MKKKCLECVVLLLFIFALTHGIIQNTQPLKETKEVQTEYEEKASQVTEKSQETEPEVQDLENQILRTASGKFFQKYPVDEAFMGWIETKYGSGVLQSLYTQLENGNQDSDLWYRFTGNSMHVLWLMYCRQQQYMSYSYEDVIWKEASDPACIRLDFVGDICLDENWCTGKTAKNHMADYFSDEVKKELISADFTMANNEFAYTTRGQRQVGKAYCFRADPKDAGFLRTLGIDMVSVANNHVFDYGEQGFLDTLDALHAAGISYSGGGRNLTEASAVRYVVTGGRKIAIVSATEIERFYHFTQKAQKAYRFLGLKTETRDFVLIGPVSGEERGMVGERSEAWVFHSMVRIQSSDMDALNGTNNQEKSLLGQTEIFPEQAMNCPLPINSSLSIQ